MEKWIAFGLLEVEIPIRNIPTELTKNGNGVKAVTLADTRSDVKHIRIDGIG